LLSNGNAGISSCKNLGANREFRTMKVGIFGIGELGFVLLLKIHKWLLQSLWQKFSLLTKHHSQSQKPDVYIRKYPIGTTYFKSVIISLILVLI